MNVKPVNSRGTAAARATRLLRLLAVCLIPALVTLLGVTEAVAQDMTEPERPANCGNDPGTIEPWQSVTSTSSSISVTFKDPMPSDWLDDSGSHAIQICYPKNTTVYGTQFLPTEATNPAAGTTYMISEVRNSLDFLVHTIQAETDYWISTGNYTNQSKWYYIRTTAASSNNAPVFTSQPATASVAENSADGTAVVTVAATDADNDTIAYSLDTASDKVFDIDSSGNITVQVESGSALNHEGTSSYTATVTANDGTDDATHDVTISVTDVTEPPGAPAAPTVTGASPTGVTVTWTAPANTGPPIFDYNVRFKLSSASTWTNHNFSGATTTTSIGSLTAGATYDVQVKAQGAEGQGPWSPTGSGATHTTITIAAGTSPVTEGTAATFTVTSNPAPSADVMVNLTVADASGSDFVASGDEGSKTVTIAASATSITHSVPTTADSTDEPNGNVTVTVNSATGYTVGSTSSASVTVNDDDDPAVVPAAPAAPTVAGAFKTGLEVSWAAPASLGTGTAVTDYDLRYFAGTADPANEADWVEEGETKGPPNPGTNTSAIITGLTKDQAYRVQVRAAAGHGESPWSASVAGTPANQAPRVLVEKSGECRVATETDLMSPLASNRSGGSFVSLVLFGREANEWTEFPADCEPFDDRDGDALTYAIDTSLVPDHVRFSGNTPTASQGRLFAVAFVARQQNLDFDLGVTATDPSGLSSAKGLLGYRAGGFDGSATPSFSDTVAAQTWTRNAEITALTLPAAGGGDLEKTAFSTTVSWPYLYEVAGLPAGLSFDADTREIKGTPTATGSFTVTYTAQDADIDTSATDTASLTFMVTVRAPGTPTAGALVSNHGQADDGTASFANDLAQPFTTGSNTPGYKLTSVEVVGKSTGSDPSYSVAIHEDSSNAPGTKVGNLSAPALTATDAVIRFTASGSGLDLDAGTTYWLVIDNSTETTTATIKRTSSTAEDSGAAGWSIGDTRLFRGFGDTTWTSHTQPLKIGVHGTANVADPPTFAGAIVVGGALDVVFNERLDSNSVPAPAPGDFAVTVNSSGRTVASNGVTINPSSDTFVQLTLSSAVTPGQTVTVAYTKPTTNPLQDKNGDTVADFAAQTVVNRTLAPAPPGLLVSNTGQTQTSRFQFSTSDTAQAFTTGSHGAGYALTSVGFDVHVSRPFSTTEPDYTVSIWSSDSDGHPDSNLGALTNPDRLGAGVNHFTASGAGIDLAAGTTYLVVLAVTSLGDIDPQNDFTASDNEDAGGATGWTIGDRALTKGSGGWASLNIDTNLPIAVHGTEKTDSTAPSFSSATVDGSTLKVVFNEDLDTGSVPAPGDFDVQVAGSRRNVASSGVAIADATVTLTLSSAVTHGQTVTVAYTKPAANPLRDASENDVADFAAQTVTNDTGATTPATGALVSNTGQTDGGAATLRNDHAQAFTTGANAAGYTLSRVDLEIAHDATAPTYSVGIHAATSTGNPGSSVGSLTKSSSGTSGTVQFTTAGIALDAGTKYFVVIVGDSGNDSGGADSVARTTSTAEDTGGAMGWSIADDRRWRSARVGSWTTHSANVLQIAVHGIAKTAGPSVPAGCGTIASPASNVIKTVASTSTTVTVTFGAATNRSGNTVLTICEPGASNTYSTRQAQTWQNTVAPLENDTFEITGLTAGTDYWVQYAAYNLDSDWHYIRTTAGGSEPAVTPAITIAAGASPVTEGAAAEFTVTASSAPSVDLTVNLTVADASGSDFVASGDEGSKTVTIAANAATATHSVPTTADTTDEPNGNVTVTVKSGTGYTVGSTASAGVTVNDDDDGPADTAAPVAKAGADREVTPGATVTLDGSKSTAPPGATLAYAWSRTAGPAVTLNNAKTARASFTAPNVLAGTELTFRLTVTATGGASNGLTATDDVTLTVSDAPPRFVGGVRAMRLDPGEEMTPVTLPAAAGGNGGPYEYELASAPAELAGLDFDPGTRRLSGTPEAEGSWTFTYTAHDGDANTAPSDAARLTFRVTVSTVSPERRRVIRRSLAAVAERTVTSALDNNGARLGDAVPAAGLTVAGESVPLGASAAPDAPDGACPAGGFGQTGFGRRDLGAGCGRAGRGRGVTREELMRTSAFSLALGAAEEGGGLDPREVHLSVWGRGDFGAFAGRPEPGMRFEGKTRTGWLGIDARAGRWVAGLAASHGISEADYSFDGGDDPSERGELKTELSALYPYGRWTFANGLELRGIVGAGTGRLRHFPGGDAPVEASDLTMWMASTGLRRKLPPVAGIDLSARGDVSFGRIETAKGPGEIDGLTADSRRVRAGLEASRRFEAGSGRSYTPFLEVAARRDGGDGLTGSGLEMAGGLRHSAPGIQFELRGPLAGGAHPEGHGRARRERNRADEAEGGRARPVAVPEPALGPERRGRCAVAGRDAEGRIEHGRGARHREPSGGGARLRVLPARGPRPCNALGGALALREQRDAAPRATAQARAEVRVDGRGRVRRGRPEVHRRLWLPAGRRAPARRRNDPDRARRRRRDGARPRDPVQARCPVLTGGNR